MPRPLAVAFVCVLLLGGLQPAGSGAGQVVGIPSAYPETTAADRDWFREREPIQFAGDSYYPAGPAVHFAPELMLPAGSYDGVPLFVDTSVEPYSQVLVPAGRGLLQPYERYREGELAGTTGSHTPSFPVEVRRDTAFLPHAAPQVEPGRESAPRAQPGIEAPPAETGGQIVTARTPEGNRGIWIRYQGRRWELAGEAVELDSSFKKVGTYKGFDVYEKQAGGDRQIYIPSRGAVLAPYRPAGDLRP